MQRQRRLCDLLGIELPIVQAPMAGAQDHELALAVAEAGGLGSLPCALLSAEQIREQVLYFRSALRSLDRGATSTSTRPLNLNFFCQAMPAPDLQRERQWQARLEPYYREFNVQTQGAGAARRSPFDSELCELVEELRPAVVSFHFGLPVRSLLERVRATGAKILSSATTVAEARWLERQGVDAIIAQGAEAGGHRGMFLGESGSPADSPAPTQVSSQVGTMALVPQVVDAVQVPVLAAGGIGDARGVLAALALGASGVQIGTAYLKCRESKVSPLHRAALSEARDDSTLLTNVFTGRPARSIANRLTREVGPLSLDAPAFPNAATALVPLRTQAEARGSSDFTPLWSGQAVALPGSESAAELTRGLWAEALEWLERLKA